jgi:hypothetical protein
MVIKYLKNHLLGRNKPGSPERRIIIGVKPPVYQLLIAYIAIKRSNMRDAAEHLIRLGIATEQELKNLHLLEEATVDSMPIRSHLKERRYIAVNRQLHYLIKGYGKRRNMTIKTATEHLICLGIVAEDAIEELESIEKTIIDQGKIAVNKPHKHN